jgi:hypothetical protein
MTTLQTNLEHSASTQLTGYDFNSYCRFGEHLLACRGDALCSIGGTSGTEEVSNSLIETFFTDLDHDGKKRVRFIYLTIETDGDVTVTPIVDDVEQTPVTFSSVTPGKQLLRKPVVRDAVGFSWKFRIENVDGCWFALKKVEALPVNLSLGR